MAKAANPLKSQISFPDVRFRIYPLSILFKNGITGGASYSLEIEKGKRILRQYPQKYQELQKGTQLPLNKIENKITFSVASQKSTVLHWNLYNGVDNQTLAEFAKFDIKPSFEDGYKPAKMQRKTAKNPDTCQEKQCTFVKCGIVIKFLLLISENDEKLDDKEKALIAGKKLVQPEQPKDKKVQKKAEPQSEIAQSQIRSQIKSTIMQIKAPEAAISLKSDAKIQESKNQSKLPKIMEQEEYKKQQTSKLSVQEQIKWPQQSKIKSQTPKDQSQVFTQQESRTQYVKVQENPSTLQNNTPNTSSPKQQKKNNKKPAKIPQKPKPNKLVVIFVTIIMLLAAFAQYQYGALEKLGLYNPKSTSKTKKSKTK